MNGCLSKAMLVSLESQTMLKKVSMSESFLFVCRTSIRSELFGICGGNLNSIVKAFSENCAYGDDAFRRVL